jgi:ElaB/YqjD/DUF883 family membrane-anchored ribosome-binding protein
MYKIAASTPPILNFYKQFLSSHKKYLSQLQKLVPENNELIKQINNAIIDIDAVSRKLRRGLLSDVEKGEIQEILANIKNIEKEIAKKSLQNFSSIRENFQKEIKQTLEKQLLQEVSRVGEEEVRKHFEEFIKDLGLVSFLLDNKLSLKPTSNILKEEGKGEEEISTSVGDQIGQEEETSTLISNQIEQTEQPKGETKNLPVPKQEKLPASPEQKEPSIVIKQEKRKKEKKWTSELPGYLITGSVGGVSGVAGAFLRKKLPTWAAISIIPATVIPTAFLTEYTLPEEYKPQKLSDMFKKEYLKERGGHLVGKTLVGLLSGLATYGLIRKFTK